MYILYLVFSCIVLPCWRNKVYIIGSASNTNLLSELGTLFPEPTILTKKSEFTLKIVGKNILDSALQNRDCPLYICKKTERFVKATGGFEPRTIR